MAPPSGFLFSLQSAPLEANFEATPVGSKRGVAQIHFLREPFFTNLPLVTWGDGSIEAAAQEGGIQTVHYVDYEVLSVLGIYVQLTVKASGD
ncbi:MAG: TRL-like family protein [Myxococcota bacterium]